MTVNYNSRSAFIDNFKGILIILVVFAHILYGITDSHLISDIVTIIYFFHMPAFVFITGFLSKSTHSRDFSSLIKLLSLYFIFNTLMFFLMPDGNNNFLTTPLYSNWYLLAVIAWRLIAERLSKIKGIIAITTAVALAIGFFTDVTNVFAISRIIAFLPFFMCGYIFDKEKFTSFYTNRKPVDFFKGGALLLISLLIIFLYNSAYSVSSDELLMFSYQNIGQIINRGAIFMFSGFIIISMVFLIPNKRILLISNAGKYSLAVFLFHRYPTLIASRILNGHSDLIVIIASVVITILIALIFGNKYTELIIEKISALLSRLITTGFGSTKIKSELITRASAIAVSAVLLFVPFLYKLSDSFQSEDAMTDSTETEAVSNDKIYKRVSDQQQNSFDDSFTILFSGDLILLEDQVKNARQEDGSYSFDDVFEYTKPYISDADMAIGVFEGPMVGSSSGYSTSNYDDGKTLALNFPDEFAYAVKNAGFDLVTTANNHLLDKGLPGALRTMDVLNKADIDFTGSYRDAEDKRSNRIKLIESDGIKIAVISYTYGSNGYTEENFLDDGQFSFLTSVLVSPDSVNFDSVKYAVSEDFKYAKSLSPDLIIALPHMGEQFLDAPDDYQKAWTNIFFDEGADIVFNDHTHSVQPVEYNDGKILVNCPGNFVNGYREHNGDCAAMIEVYIDRTTKSPIGAGIIPMWIQSPLSMNYRALPIYSIKNDDELRKQISTDDYKRVKEVWNHITSVMIGEPIPFDMISKKCYITDGGYLAPPVKPLELTPEIENSVLYKKLISAQSVCFVGDSITHGTKNGGYGWFEPLNNYLNSYSVCAEGGATTKTILNMVNADSELYVVAIGTNDVRYRDESICSMTSEEYITQIDSFVKRIRSANSDAEFAFVAPWTALETDPYSACSITERDRLLSEYSKTLADYCTQNNFIFCNPTNALNSVFSLEIQSDYLVDHIHPNCTAGIELYCREVLLN